MIEANNTEIQVDELMQKIREEVSRHNSLPSSVEEKLSDVIERRTVIKNGTFSYLQTLLNDAECYSQVPSKFPDKLNHFPFNISKQLHIFVLKLYGFLFKKQRVVNFSLIQVLRESLALNQQLINQVNALHEQLSGMGERFTAVEIQLSGMSDRLTTTEIQLSGIGDRLTTTEIQLSGMSDRLTTTEIQLSGMSDRFTMTEAQLSGMSDRFTMTEAQLSGIGDRFTTTHTQLREVGDHLTIADQQRQELAVRISATEGQLKANEKRLKAANERITTTEQRYSINDSYLKNDLIQQKRLITLFLEEARQRLPEPFSQEQLQTFVKADRNWLDALYVAFEEQFRGSRELIFERLKVYLPLIKEAKIGTQESPILDVGCGRGEWLELLRDSGYIAQGLDINRVALDQCRARELEVVEKDVISYLQTLPNDSLGAVTGFHIIEHLQFEVLVNLLDEILRVLKPGGLALFETPNPQNVLVGSCDFYTDPTHKNPLPSSTVKFLAESRGLGRVQILNVNPSHLVIVEDDSDLAKRFNEYFYGYLDYAVVGFKL